MPQMPINSYVSVYMPHMNSLQLILSPQALLYIRGLLQSFPAMEHTLVYSLSLMVAASRVTGKPNARVTVPTAVWTVIVWYLRHSNSFDVFSLLQPESRSHNLPYWVDAGVWLSILPGHMPFPSQYALLLFTAIMSQLQIYFKYSWRNP